MLVLSEVESKGVERPVGAEPQEVISLPLECWFEMLGVACSHGAVDAVGGDDQIGIGEVVELVDLGLEMQLHAQRAGAILQYQQQFAPSAAAETVAARADRLALEYEIDLIPVGECAGYRLVGLWVLAEESVQGLVGKNDAETKGIVGAVALVDVDPGLGRAFFIKIEK